MTTYEKIINRKGVKPDEILGYCRLVGNSGKIEKKFKRDWVVRYYFENGVDYAIRAIPALHTV